MEVEEIKAKLEARDYYISPNYGLILEKKESESAIADIRLFESKVVLPYWNKKETQQVKHLRGILLQEDIPFRENLQGSN